MFIAKLNNHVSELSKNGFTVMKIPDDLKQCCENFLNEARFERQKDDPSSMYPVHLRELFKSIINLELKKIFVSKKLKNFCSQNKFKNIADAYFNQESILTKIDSYVSHPSSANILNWHTDMASPQPSKNDPNQIEPINPDRGLLKFNLFLTDSIGEDVSFAVIPESHRVSRAYKELLYAKLVNFQKHHWISEFKSILKDSLIKKKMIEKVGESFLNNFLLNIDFNEEVDTKKFDIPLKFMNVVIFDEHTYHRAKSPKHSSRFIFRFCYGRKKIYSN